MRIHGFEAAFETIEAMCSTSVATPASISGNSGNVIRSEGVQFHASRMPE